MAVVEMARYVCKMETNRLWWDFQVPTPSSVRCGTGTAPCRLLVLPQLAWYLSDVKVRQFCRCDRLVAAKGFAVCACVRVGVCDLLGL